MSIITIQIGQCGNQMGYSFYDYLYNEAAQSSQAHQAMVADTFFIEDEKTKQLVAKSLLIDMEPKVVNKCLLTENQKTWKYSREFSYCKQEGSGNNWAYGFNVHGKKSHDILSEKISKLLEKIDYSQGVILMQSLAGGTGSGLGSYLLELIDDEFHELQKFNICVVPHISGEVILQSYNCVLTIANLQEKSDGIILIENDLMQEICHQLLNLSNPSLDQMNNVISHHLNSIFYPVIESNSSNVFSSLQNKFNYFTDIQDTLLFNPKYKFMTIKTVPQMPANSKSFSNDSWNALEKRIAQLLITQGTEAKINWSVKPGSQQSQKTIGNLIIARGTEVLKHDFQFQLDHKIYMEQRISQKLIKDSSTFQNTDRSISILTNSQFCVNSLETIVERAHQMFQEKAYIYQYENFGLNQSYFLDCLATFEQIIHNYKKM